jgi:hypothetical protein
MKLYISEHIDRAISGFKIIPIVYGEIDLGGIPANSASTIVAIDAIDSIKYENIEQFIQGVVGKMRLESNLYIGGLDVYAVNRALISGSLNLEEYNKLLVGRQGIQCANKIVDLLQKNGVKILSVVFKGNNYEISATRKPN